MTLRSLMRVHEDVLRQGWALTTATEMGLASAGTRDALAPALAPDPRGPGKQQALDVVTYERDGAHLLVAEAGTNVIDGVADGVARCWLIGEPGAAAAPAGDLVPRAVLQMVPASLRQRAGRMSATFLRYGLGAESHPHQDKFGDMVVLWVLDRDGDGGESFLVTADREDVLRRTLLPGEMLIFRDEMFLHGVTPMRGDGALRDVLVFVTLRD